MILEKITLPNRRSQSKRRRRLRRRLKYRRRRLNRLILSGRNLKPIWRLRRRRRRRPKRKLTILESKLRHTRRERKNSIGRPPSRGERREQNCSRKRVKLVRQPARLRKVLTHLSRMRSMRRKTSRRSRHNPI